MTQASKARAVLRSILSSCLIPIRDQPNHTGNNVFLSSRIFCHSFSETFLHRADSSDLTITAYRDVIYDAQNGIFWVNGEPILDLTTTFSRSLLEGNRGGKLRQPNEADLPVLEEIEVNSVICPHYGHFLIESTGWLWPLFLSEDSNIPRVIATRANRNVDTEKPGNGQLAAYLKELRSAKTSLATLFYSNSYIYELTSFSKHLFHRADHFNIFQIHARSESFMHRHQLIHSDPGLTACIAKHFSPLAIIYRRALIEVIALIPLQSLSTCQGKVFYLQAEKPEKL